MTKVAHLTSVHQVSEPRILFKQCKSLAAAGYEVVFIVPADEDQIIEGVQIRAVPRPGSRLQRFTRTILQVYRKALRQGGWLAGLAIFPPNPHYYEKELTKFFEYMGAGLPIVCSDFPAWRTLMAETGAGICVDPQDPESI